MKITKDQILENLDQVKKYISEIDNKPKIEKDTEHWLIDRYNEKTISFWDDEKWSIRLLKNHNVYLKEADCDKQIAKNEALNKIKTFIKDNFDTFVPDWEVEDENKYSIYYDYKDEEWDYYFNDNFRELTLLPFLKSEKQAEQLIKDCRKELDILIK